MQKHLSYLDGWRGCAILLLLFGHFNPVQMIAGHWIYTGRLGVECFFVLSGRLMAEILFIGNTKITTFYWRRFSRIFPALWLFVILVWLTVADVTASDVVRALTFTANYSPINDTLQHIWSLCVEEHSYVLLSIIALIARARRFNVPMVLGIIAAACAVNGLVQTIWLHRSYLDVYVHSDVRAASVLMGSAWYLALRDKSVPSWLPIIAGLIGLFIGVYDKLPDTVKYTAGTLGLAIAVATLDQAPAWCRTLLSLKPLTKIGEWSFSLYLWQQPFFIVKTLPLAIRLGLLSVLALTSYYVVERPARKALNEAWRNRLRSLSPATSSV